MKKLLLLITFLVSGICLNAQAPPNIKSALTAGDELTKAGNHLAVGMLITLGGGFVMAIPALMNDTKDTTLSNTPYYIAGGCISGIGTILLIEGFSHLNRAGEILNRNKIGITFNNTGIGIRYSFNKRKKFKTPSAS